VAAVRRGGFMPTFSMLVYALCMMTSLLCLVLLARGYRRTRIKLLYWSALCFVGLAINNLLLFLDYFFLPDVDLRPARTAAMIGALAVLLYGFIWKTE
jgi:hypothetical protein